MLKGSTDAVFAGGLNPQMAETVERLEREARPVMEDLAQRRVQVTAAATGIAPSPPPPPLQLCSTAAPGVVVYSMHGAVLQASGDGGEGRQGCTTHCFRYRIFKGTCWQQPAKL